MNDPSEALEAIKTTRDGLRAGTIVV